MFFVIFLDLFLFFIVKLHLLAHLFPHLVLDFIETSLGLQLFHLFLHLLA